MYTSQFKSLNFPSPEGVSGEDHFANFIRNQQSPRQQEAALRAIEPENERKGEELRKLKEEHETARRQFEEVEARQHLFDLFDDMLRLRGEGISLSTLHVLNMNRPGKSVSGT